MRTARMKLFVAAEAVGWAACALAVDWTGTAGNFELDNAANWASAPSATTWCYVKTHPAQSLKVGGDGDFFGGAIRSTKGLLGHFHTGECNRRVPGRGRTPWHEIALALKDIGYDGNVCMEPFVRMGGKVGEDIKIWRELEPGVDETKMDADAKAALDFERIVFEGVR